jgi:hypothetical protein
MNWFNVLLTSLTSGVMTSAILTCAFFLLKEWASQRLSESIGAEYKKALELFKQQIAWEEKRKQQAAEVADLFSLWLLANYDKTRDPNLINYELQKKYWELVLWLDAPVLQAVHEAFKSASNPGITHKKALIAVRRIYVGQNDPILPEELHHWNPLPAAAGNPKDDKA